jgi:hypothetical protein
LATSAIELEPAELLIFSSSRRLVCAALFGAAALSLGMDTSATAQGFPPNQQDSPSPQSANPICQRLEGQLAMIDRGGADPAKADQIRRYEDAQTKQQGELDRVTMQARRMGCDSTGFFSLFNGQSAQCGPVNNQIQQMRGNLDQMTSSLQQLRGGGSDRDMQRRSVLVALAQNNCGPQYAAAARNAQQQGGFFDNFLGGPGSISTPDSGAPAGTYRTVCVRSCDGFYFPISFATVQSRFADDERTCKSLCPASEANLYSYRNPGEDINQAVSISGQPYSSSPNAFHYRQAFDPACSCRAAGQSWADALKNLDDKAAAEQQGDIIVTEDSAKKMARPVSNAKPAGQKKGGTAAAPADASTDQAPADTNTKSGKIRSVGPTFIPAPR